MAESRANIVESEHPDAPHAFFEILKKSHELVEKGHKIAEAGNNAIKLYRGTQAFHKYSWMKNVPRLNSAGNLRGMVYSKKYKTIYDVVVKRSEALEKSGEFLKRIGNYLFLASVAIEISDNMDKMLAPNNSAEDVQRKLLIPSMAIFKIVGGLVPAGAQAIASTAEFVCGHTGIACGHIQDIKDMNVTVQQTYKEIMDPENVLHYINTVVEPNINTVVVPYWFGQ